jgi:hypothetical protein
LGTPEFAGRSDADVDHLVNARELAVSAHGGYTHADVDVSMKVLFSDSKELALGVVEDAAFYFAGSHPSDAPASRYRINHEVRLTRLSSNKWTLTDARYLPKGPIPPLTQLTPGSAPSREHRVDIADPDLGPPSSIERSADVRRAVKNRGIRAADGRYDYQMMINWAILWWNGRSPDYPNFHDAGGDCTNFVSQCMSYGGWEYIGPPGQATRSKWFPGKTVDTCSFTWGGANPFHSFARLYSGRMRLIDNIWYLVGSEVIQYDFSGNGTIDHTQFVRRYFYDEHTLEIYMTQHDDDYFDKPLSEILATLQRTDPNFKSYGLQHIT